MNPNITTNVGSEIQKTDPELKLALTALSSLVTEMQDQLSCIQVAVDRWKAPEPSPTTNHCPDVSVEDPDYRQRLSDLESRLAATADWALALANKVSQIL